MEFNQEELKYKSCPRCKNSKSIIEFGKTCSKKDGLQTFCKLCANEISKRYYYDNDKRQLYGERTKRKRSELQKALDFIKMEYGCRFCQEKLPICLDFHHLNGKDKSFQLSSNQINRSIDKLVNEINKCEIVCANCHRKIHGKILILNDCRKFDVSIFDNFILNKNTREKKPNSLCIDCGNKITRGYTRCRACARETNYQKYTKLKISNEELSKLVWEKSIEKIAKEQMVTPKVVNLRCKKYNIQKPPRGYWQKQQALLNQQIPPTTTDIITYE